MISAPDCEEPFQLINEPVPVTRARPGRSLIPDRRSDRPPKGAILPGVCPGSSQVRNTTMFFSGSSPAIVRPPLKK